MGFYALGTSDFHKVCIRRRFIILLTILSIHRTQNVQVDARPSAIGLDLLIQLMTILNKSLNEGHHANSTTHLFIHHPRV
jgi:hypothetical protein